MLALMTTDQRKAGAVAQFQAQLAQLVKLHQGLLQLEEGIKQASEISLPVEGREERFNPNAEVLASLQKAKTTLLEQDELLRRAFEISRIALRNDWNAARSAQKLQKGEDGRSLEERAVRMAEEENKKRERDSSTPAKKRRGAFSAMSGQSGTKGQFGGRRQEQQGTSWQTQPPWQLAPWQPPTYSIPFPQQAVYSQAGYLNGFFPPPPTHQATLTQPQLPPLARYGQPTSSGARSPRQPFSGQCNYCREFGHKIAECTKKK
jgi:hypothetical protein